MRRKHPHLVKSTQGQLLGGIQRGEVIRQAILHILAAGHEAQRILVDVLQFGNRCYPNWPPTTGYRRPWLAHRPLPEHGLSLVEGFARACAVIGQDIAACNRDNQHAPHGTLPGQGQFCRRDDHATGDQGLGLVVAAAAAGAAVAHAADDPVGGFAHVAGFLYALELGGKVVDHQGRIFGREHAFFQVGDGAHPIRRGMVFAAINEGGAEVGQGQVRDHTFATLGRTIDPEQRV